MTSDLRHALRMLRQSPAFTLLVVSLLALGIGFGHRPQERG